jgi:hypothetical protein
LQNAGVEALDLRIVCGGFQCEQNGFTGLCGVEDSIDPQTRGGVAAVGLRVIGGLDAGADFFFFSVA